MSAAVARYLAEEASDVISGAVGAADIVAAARGAIGSLLVQHGGTDGDFACTLVALLVSDDKTVAVHLGDGLIACVDDGAPRLLSAPDNGEFANETTFCTSPNAVLRTRIQVIELQPDTTSLALMTDGADKGLFEKKTQRVSTVIEQMASWLDQGTEEEVAIALANAITTHLLPKTGDDCTVAVLRRMEILPEFVCHGCGSEDGRRGSGWPHLFRVVCANCKRSIVHERVTRKRHPIVAQRWVEHLVRERRLRLRALEEVTRMPRELLVRWVRIARRPQTAEVRP